MQYNIEVNKGTSLMTNFTLPAGRYLIADGCNANDEYYDNVLLDTFIEWDEGEYGMANDETFIYCTGNDGGGDVHDGDTKIGEFGIDASNLAVIPAEFIDEDQTGGVWVEFTEEFTITVDQKKVREGEEEDGYEVTRYTINVGHLTVTY